MPISPEFFKRLVEELTVELDGEFIRITAPVDDKYFDVLAILINELNNEVMEYACQESQEKVALAQFQDEDDQLIKQIHDISFHEIDLSLAKPTLFPLRDNMIFGHAIQLAFDVNISNFIIDAQKIENTNFPLERKRRQLIEAMQQILPIIKTYLQLLMGITGQALPAHIHAKAYQPIMP